MTKYLVFNWKMNPASLEQAIELYSSYTTALIKNTLWDAVICPPSVFLSTLSNNSIKCSFGAQNIAKDGCGSSHAFTGEVSAEMVKGLGCEYTLIGHSERRSMLKETNDDVQKKVVIARENNLIPIICVGHVPPEMTTKSDDIDYLVLKEQVISALMPYFDSMSVSSSNITIHFPIIAYEPVWAIGTGKTPSINQIVSVNIAIHGYISDLLGAEFSRNVSILYGGSVNENNIRELSFNLEIDGFLIGGAGLKPESVKQIIELE